MASICRVDLGVNYFFIGNSFEGEVEKGRIVNDLPEQEGARGLPHQDLAGLRLTHGPVVEGQGDRLSPTRIVSSVQGLVISQIVLTPLE